MARTKINKTKINKSNTKEKPKKGSIEEKIADAQGQLAVLGGMRLGMNLAEAVSTKDKKEQEKKLERFKEDKKIMSEGISALGSLMEITHAVSTEKRFQEWTDKFGYRNEEWDVDRKSWNKGEPVEREGELFYPHEEFRKRGYGAYHIGSEISQLQKEGRKLLIVNSSRNRRFLYATAKKR